MELFRDFPVLVPMLALVVAEVLKLFVDFSRHRHHLEARDFLQSGGMPSGHATAVSALCATILLKFGVASGEFSIAVIFAFLVLYDALKLRRAAGRHAAELNRMLGEKKFNERLGHTPFELAAGIFLGGGLAFLFLF